VRCDLGRFGANEGTERVEYSLTKNNIVSEYEYVQREKQERPISKHTKSEVFAAGPVCRLCLRHSTHTFSHRLARERAPNDANRTRFESAIPQIAEFD
jgi:hypothetical protein